MRPVVLCGGSGDRLWPLSRPKQFQNMFGQHTMFKDTLLRLKSDYLPPIIATNIQYESFLMKDLYILHEYKVIFEPIKIGTAAAILIAALLCDENEVMLVLPSDHFITDMNNFHDVIEKARQVTCKSDAIVTLGVKPSEFNSEYGYINALYDQNKGYHIVKSFCEKPKIELSNDHYWNSGIFVFKAKRYIDEVKKLAPNLYKLCCRAIIKHPLQENFLYLSYEDFQEVQNISIDYLIMEKTTNIAMIEVEFDWIDVGTWNSVLILRDQVKCSSSSHDCLCEEDGEFVLEQISENPHVLSKSLISFINNIKRVKVIHTEYKPWGFFNVILVGQNFLVKYLFINPLSCTSQQLHNYRNEYHIILSGIGHISLGIKTYILEQNDIITIPKNTYHRIENKDKKEPLEIVEFQTGSYISEDDIVRLDDIYGRV